ncbi:SDR family NAD(P)-dependent oxidoreductase [Aliiruegeria lutimaris]|uniref:NADP-dependent 3-hydroxy acid dehydrogenase YdfG n=1 Tax=Aliiruegeria lutimaris TaxID=571298 RepID=A0A1G8LP06_9RHOB|nr:SDR family NAD(P)-dependent oxidoreductase [Aliiruegeria lutimaris]SDI57177.1 NADP-dependent 3-hydroxy acid dehydrogenase YdfG [Aliiruegeria lutimaris]
MVDSVFNADSVAVITGSGAGIGLALAQELASVGMRVVLVDNRADLLEAAARKVRDAGAADVMTRSADVSDEASMASLEAEVAERFGGTDILVNNAGIQPGSAMFGPRDAWEAVLKTNLWGVINGTRAFATRMIERGRPGMIVNTGSKQGITTPPGDPAYNVAKAGVKAYTEALAHELRSGAGAHLSAHLLIPGFVFTELTAGGRTQKPDGAWSPEELARFAMEKLREGDFYILCPDNDVSRELDEKRMTWAMGDIIENRPALSRWHPDYAEAFEAYIFGRRRPAHRNLGFKPLPIIWGRRQASERWALIQTKKPPHIRAGWRRQSRDSGGRLAGAEARPEPIGDRQEAGRSSRWGRGWTPPVGRSQAETQTSAGRCRPATRITMRATAPSASGRRVASVRAIRSFRSVNIGAGPVGYRSSFVASLFSLRDPKVKNFLRTFANRREQTL